MTVLAMVKDIQREVMTGELHPERASKLLLQASALLGNCAEEIRAVDAEFAVVLLHHLEGEEAANRARIRAETTPEYQRKREARDTRELLKEIVGSLKYFLKAQSDEMRLAR